MDRIVRLDNSSNINNQLSLRDNNLNIALLRNSAAVMSNKFVVIPLDRISNKSKEVVNTTQDRLIWEIDGRLRCPVIGNCLSLSEQKKILKKAGVAYKRLSDFEIHTTLTQGISEESPLSLRTQNYLNNKYKVLIANTGVCSTSDFFSNWKKGLKHGEIDGLLWIAVVKLNLSEDEIDTLFGDIHMLMHAQGNIVRRGLRKVDQLKEENKKLTSKLQSTQKRVLETSNELSLLNKKLIETEKKLDGFVHDNKKLLKRDSTRIEENLKKENERLVVKLHIHINKIHTLDNVINSERIVTKKLRTELASLKKIKVQEGSQIKSDCSTCISYDLCQKRILLVGGMTKLRPFYQKLVENTGGEFKHHDGHNGGSKHRLENWVDWADIVLCPVDVNSHSACLNVKRTCKKLDKSYQMLSSSSVSSISRALESVAKINN